MEGLAPGARWSVVRATGNDKGGEGRGRALLLSENAPVPADRRVWNESRTLVRDGWDVVVVCAGDATRPQPPVETIDGVEIHRYPLTQSAGSARGYVREYCQAAWRVRRLVRELARTRRFDIVHAANPPDFLLAVAADLRVRGTRMIFDHHDFVPELFRSRFGSRVGLRAMLACERMAFAPADTSVASAGVRPDGLSISPARVTTTECVAGARGPISQHRLLALADRAPSGQTTVRPTARPLNPERRVREAGSWRSHQRQAAPTAPRA